MNKRDGEHTPPPGGCFLGTDDASDPVTTFDQHLGPQPENAGKRGVVLKPGHIVDAGKRCCKRQPIFETIDGAIFAFAKPANRLVTVKSQHKALAFLRGCIEQTDMAAMQQVVDTVGKHQWTRAPLCEVLKLRRLEDF